MSNLAMSQQVSFWDKLAERYSKKPVPDEAAYQRKLNITRGYLRPEMDVMEFGCGTGTTAIAHAPHVRHILATDISAKMIEIARNKAEAAGIGNVTFDQAAIDDYAASDASFDVIMGHSILHLVEDRDPVIAKVYRMLKPGGVFVTNTACLGDKMWIFKYIGPIGQFFGLMPMVRVFTIRQLTESLVRAGFSVNHKWKPEKSHSVFIVARKPE
ncbi:class I SAM-dependent methyltransferase [Hoeflea sp.]|uniref:class I SAM-dependent methyltransferase n=1 Tax=Hoeflea sp. TaxID=1940281 RepID=UPI003B02C59C